MKSTSIKLISIPPKLVNTKKVCSDFGAQGSLPPCLPAYLCVCLSQALRLKHDLFGQKRPQIKTPIIGKFKDIKCWGVWTTRIDQRGQLYFVKSSFLTKSIFNQANFYTAPIGQYKESM